MTISNVTSPAEAAQEIHKEFGGNPPIKLETILESKKISVRYDDLDDDVSGLLVIKDGNAVISVNKTHHINRQRFTIAHELGHFLLHGRNDQVFINRHPAVFYRNDVASTGVSKTEMEANLFAAELLMPKKYLRQYVDKHTVDGFDDIALKTLAAKLQVSVQAIAIRLAKLNLV